MRALVVVGTRPEAIKMAPVVLRLRSDPTHFQPVVCVTGQHRQMLDQVLDLFGIKPDVDLNLMKPGQDLFDITTAVLGGMRSVLREARPEVVLVHGDTTTAFASATASFYEGIPVAHVEAGLRTFDLRAPFPEEFNRQVVSKVARWHFAPTLRSRENLLREGIADASIFVTGNTVIDALQWVLKRIDNDPERASAVYKVLDQALQFDWRTERFVLVTGHRRENFGEGFVNICGALRALAEAHPRVQFVYPVHLNPNVRRPVMELLDGLSNVSLIAPVDYEPFAVLLKRCQLVLTDSGGIQEEAPSLGKPVLVMREVTERPEAVDAGTVMLVGADRDRIFHNVSRLLNEQDVHERMSRAHNPYGDGTAAEQIATALIRTVGA